MAETKSLCAKIPVELHTKVRESQEERGLTLNQYIEEILTAYFEKGGADMSEKTRTMAFQVSEELFARIKEHLKKHPKLSQKEFVIGLIEKALADATGTDSTEETDGADSTEGATGTDSTEDTDGADCTENA